MIVIAIMTPIMLAIIAVAVAIPVMIVLAPAVISVPVAAVESLTIVPGAYPVCARIWSPGPIAVMPLVMVPNRVPVTVDPEEFRAWSRGKNTNFSRGRRRADSDSDRDLTEH